MKALLVVTAIYLAALLVALAAAWPLGGQHPLLVAFVADCAGTLIVFAFSFALRNSSLYDPYWSVAPVPIALYFLALGPELTPRAALCLALVAIWGARLTWNWAVGWGGLAHQDWRYDQLQDQTGRAYWWVSFSGIHLLPTLLVFAGCLALYPALALPAAPFGALDAVATLVTVSAIAIEAVADTQLRRFRRGRPPPGSILDTGLWRWSRHPNYFGELTLWWGLWLFALAARPDWWWTVVGPLAMTGLFAGISIPLIEKRMAARRPGWPDYVARTSVLVPLPPRR